METEEPMPFKIRKEGFSYGIGVGAVVMNKNHPGCVEENFRHYFGEQNFDFLVKNKIRNFDFVNIRF